jgi:PAS domain S-box-containing protein
MHKRLRRQLEEALGQEQEASLLLRKLFHKIEEHRRVDGARDSLQHALAFLSELLQRQPEAQPRRANSTRTPSTAWLFDQAPFAALVCNADRKVTAWNAAAEQLFGLPSSEVVGRELSMLVFPGDDLEAARARTALRQALASGGTEQHLQPTPTRAGGARTFDWTIVSLRDGKGREAGNAALVQERDPLRDRYARACQAVGDGIWDWDLDGERLWLSESFRAIVGAQAESEAPSEWIDRVHPEERDAVQAAIRMHLDGLSPRFESEHRLRHEDGSWRRVLARGRAARDAGGKAVRFSGSAMELTEPRAIEASLRDGLTLLPDRAQICGRLRKGLREGDAPTRSTAGELAILIEDVKDGAVREGAPHLLELKAELRQALARDQFRVHYLPIVDATTRHIGGFEALIRWDHPTLGLVAPEHFMPYAEETGLMVPMGRWLLGQASREFKGWRAVSREPLTLNVNLSSRQLRHAGLLESIDAVLTEQGLDPRDLVFELTEDIVQQGEHAERIAELHHRGVQLYMEDFGTGACSLNSLNRLEFDCLKIGSSLFTGGSPRGKEPVLVRTVVSLARGLAMRVVAEGVETAEQFEFLCEAGCSAGQGFYFSPSVDGEGARSLLERSASW